MAAVTEFNYNNLIEFENKKISAYHQFVNWVSGEFDLFLKDDSDGLKVYFPNGLVWIRSEIESQKSTILVEIKSNSSKKGEKLTNELTNLFIRMENLY